MMQKLCTALVIINGIAMIQAGKEIELKISGSSEMCAKVVTYV